MVFGAIQELASGFEGCEKKVEIDFHVPAGGPDLRSIPRSAIDGFLSLAKCTVISTRNNAHFDSYLLSESSLFIFPTKILLKTCGTTLLLKSVGAILAAARAVKATPDFLQFSRSNFIFPSKQHFPHRAFSEETEYLNKLLGKEGDAFILGPLHGPRWHLYIVDFNEVDASAYKQQTCELIMFNLDPKVMKQFYQQAKEQEAGAAASSSSSASAPTPMEDESKEAADQIKNTSGQGYANTNGEGSRTGDEATKRSGIDLLLPGSSIDGFLFSPCGYSCNGLLNDTYFTIHITPEPECSFVSFETNYNTKSFTALVNQVTNTFRPGSFCLSLFVDEESLISDSRKGLDWANVTGYTAKATTHHVFAGGYNATCAHYDLTQANGASGSAAFGVAASSAASALKKQAHPLDGLVGPASYETIASLPTQQIHTLAKDAARNYVEFETPLDQKEMEVDAVTVETPKVEGEVTSTSSSAWLSACAQGVVARHQPEQSFVLVDLGQLTARFHAWTKRFPRIQPFLSVGDWGLDAGMLCVLSALGCGFAFASGAGLSHVIAAGVPATRLMFEREYQTSAQLRAARDQNVEFVTFASKSELSQIAIQHPKAKLLLRVHPKQEAPVTRSALAVEIEQATAMTAEATALGLTVAGVRLQTVAGLSAAAIKSTILALQAPFKASVATDYSFDVLDLAGALNDLTDAESAEALALLDASFVDTVRYHANASMFLEQRTHTLYLNVLAKEAATTVAAPAAAASSSSSSTKRKVDQLSVVAPTASSFLYHVSTALAPPSSSQHAKVAALQPRAGAAVHSSSLLALSSAGNPSVSVSCLVSELAVGDWLSVSESAAWCPSSFLAPHANFKGQSVEPSTYYVFGQ